MKEHSFEVESSKLFSESLIWQLNRDYYNIEGIDAWRNNTVPHHMTSNSLVGKTYAEMILGLLKDLAFKGKVKETVYILELGAGHGRLAFHILRHLEKIKPFLNIELPPYCFILSDIVEDNLSFFYEHSQFKSYFEQGLLDVCYFDAIKTKELKLRYAKTNISIQDLEQPIVAIANYFFDSIPTDLFLIKDKAISACSVSLHSEDDPETMNAQDLLNNLDLIFHKKNLEKPFYEKDIYNNLLEDYKNSILDSHIFFPKNSLECLLNLRTLSKQGLMLLSIDKGFCEIQDLQKKEEPEIITHGSFSIWVNYHALGAFCKKTGGEILFPSFSTFYLQMGCLMFFADSDSYKEVRGSYQRYVDDFGPDDFNGLKRLTYENLSRLNFRDLIALLRSSYYDSTFFRKILPRLKQVTRQVSITERKRLSETMHEVWNMYFTLNEKFDLAYELGGLFYDLGFYKEALTYFQYSVNIFGHRADIYYNKILCHYQLREDNLFLTTLAKAKLDFPNYEKFEHLDTLDLGAE